MTRATVLTPPGRGAIAVVGVAGPGAVGAVDACFRARNGVPLADQPIGAIRFGRWLDERGEELIVVRRGDDVVEIHCHGGAAASAAVLRALERRGVTRADNRSPNRAWSGLALPTPLAREAWSALPNARTERVAAVLLDQAHGALDRAIDEIAAAIDAQDVADAIAKTDALLAWRRLGERLLEPTRVVIVGPPNVGKSSLINALVGYDRAIVYDRPGTTRDVVTAATAVRGWPIVLADTAGIRDTDDPLEAAGVELARRTLAHADVVVHLHEAGDHDEADVGVSPCAVTIRVASKVDLGSSSDSDAIATSVVTGEGIAELLDAISEAIAPTEPSRGAAVPYHSSQYGRLDAVREALATGTLAEASRSLAVLRES